MSEALDMASAAALVGDPARANMLTVMLDGRAHTASELAHAAGIAASTASGHLAKLECGNLVRVVPQGRHRYFRLASAGVAQMLEGIMTVASGQTAAKARATPRIDPAMRRARACYDHIAGELGVAIADALIGRGIVILSGGCAEVTPSGRVMLADLGIAFDVPRSTRRILCRPCLDWSERRPHFAGVLGAAILDHAVTSGWVRRIEGSRVLVVDGRHGGPFAVLVKDAV